MTTIEPLESEKESTEDHQETHIPFDGFVNVNDIIKERRILRDASSGITAPEAADTPKT